MNAYEWGLRHGSCREALEWRKSLGPNATQADAWRLCTRGDWLVWQYCKLPPETQRSLRPVMRRAIETIVARAVSSHALCCGIPVVERWALRWLDSTDRSTAAAEAAWAAGAAAWAAGAAAWVVRAAAWAAEYALQANDIHEQIPEWPGGDE